MKKSASGALLRLASELSQLRESLKRLDAAELDAVAGRKECDQLVVEGGKALNELERVLRHLSPQRYGSVGITLARADGMAKFFAFSFIAAEKRSLASLGNAPFWGSGIYAIYYCGKNEPAYQPLSGTETPIYVGKADPKDAFADSLESQGQSLFLRLKEHAKNIAMTELSLDDFTYRAATIQSGMQFAVEEFMIRLFLPIWNNKVGPCHGLGKHGDSAKTRVNKRSPWDTMHPGRRWAKATKANQVERPDIVSRIAEHFADHPVTVDKDALHERLALGAK